MATRVLSTVLLSFILWGCAGDEPARPAARDRAPALNVATNARAPERAPSTQAPADAQSNKTPTTIRGGEICESYLLKKISMERAGGGRAVKLEAIEGDGEHLSPGLKEWLETRDRRSLVAFELRHDGKQALVLGSQNTKATGIAANFQNWYVHLGSHHAEFLSLSEDPGLIFWDGNGLLNYYVITYGSKFLENRDWDNLTLDLLRYRVSPDGESQLVSEERNVRCE